MPHAEATTWCCRSCGAELGDVRDGRLYVGGRLVFQWVGPCPACCKRAAWHSVPAWWAYISGRMPELEAAAGRPRRCCGTRNSSNEFKDLGGS